MQHVYGLGLPTEFSGAGAEVAAIIASYVPTEANKPDSGVWGRGPSTGVGNLPTIHMFSAVGVVTSFAGTPLVAMLHARVQCTSQPMHFYSVVQPTLRCFARSSRPLVVPGLCTAGAVVRRHSLAASVGLVIVSTLCLRLIGCHRPQRLAAIVLSDDVPFSGTQRNVMAASHHGGLSARVHVYEVCSVMRWRVREMPRSKCLCCAARLQRTARLQLTAAASFVPPFYWWYLIVPAVVLHCCARGRRLLACCHVGSHRIVLP
jgi:hypothetical protein